MSSGDDARVTSLGTRRSASSADLRAEVERLSDALTLAEQRRRTAERTLADVARMAAADAADLRARLTELEARLALAETPASPAPPAAAESSTPAAAAAPPPTLRRRARRGLLLFGLLAGLLLITDGVLTIFWQEPITAIQQHRDQAALRGDLRGLQRTLQAATPKVPHETAKARMQRQATALDRAGRSAGSAMGSISIPKIGLRTVFVENTNHAALKRGPGHYKGTVLPGMTGTVGLAGHRTTYGAPFRRVNELKAGSTIVVNMPYGKFTYKVMGWHITTPSDASSLVSHAGQHRLVLTACHPLYSAAQRIVVTAKLTSSTPA
ncbi:class E sortase [Conexibacter woesei]|uniref:class E sortase n=1 Tax=Conexibacter woesei TaxID=191495 RepID=UPI00041E67D0|nr:class E sortase [Conexibacter woesei]